MIDVFISYSDRDRKMAIDLHRACNSYGLKAFLAGISISAGSQWKDEILENLRSCKWFFFLATRNSINSDACKHEIGGALTTNKPIIPILVGVEFPELPQWIRGYHGIRVTNNNTAELKRVLKEIAFDNKADIVITSLLASAAITAGLVWLANKE